MPESRLVAQLISVLEGEPRTLAEARKPPDLGGVAEVAGFYAWWAMTGALPGAEGIPHPQNPELRAFYVGISPARPGTKQRLRGRIVSNHIGGNIAASTFRLALAALLREERGYRPRLRIDSKGRRKYVLPGTQGADLRAWQHEHLRVTWAMCEEPWQKGLEAAVIAHFKPPLNSAENAEHPFHDRLSAARAAFREAAGSAPG